MFGIAPAKICNIYGKISKAIIQVLQYPPHSVLKREREGESEERNGGRDDTFLVDTKISQHKSHVFLCSGLLSLISTDLQSFVAYQFYAILNFWCWKCETTSVEQWPVADLGFWLGGGQLSDCNGLSGSNLLTNRVLNKKINNLIYILY
jgi:hypothetical protein